MDKIPWWSIAVAFVWVVWMASTVVSKVNANAAEIFRHEKTIKKVEKIADDVAYIRGRLDSDQTNP